MERGVLVLLLCVCTTAQVLMECGQDQHVVAHLCEPCDPGMTNRGGDDPNGPNTPCDGVTVCASHEFAQGGVCKECPEGTMVQAPADDLIQVAFGFSIPCIEFSCTRPDSTTGYDLSAVVEQLSGQSFSVSSLRCDAGYAGTPVAMSCTALQPHRASAYSLGGCERCDDSSFASMAGLKQCFPCHKCGRNEVETRRCTQTSDRICACAPGYEGQSSSAENPVSHCRKEKTGDEEVIPASPRMPVDAYNLGTLIAHCQMWVRENHPEIAVINQHLASGRPDVPGFDSCQNYCAHFYTRREATVCHGLCDLVGRQHFVAGLQDIGASEFKTCTNVFEGLKTLPGPLPDPKPDVPVPPHRSNATNATKVQLHQQVDHPATPELQKERPIMHMLS